MRAAPCIGTVADHSVAAVGVKGEGMNFQHTVPVALPLTPLPDDAPTPPVAVYGNGLSERAFMQTRRHTHAARWMMTAVTVLLLVFGFGAAGLAALHVGAAHGTFLWGMLAVAGGVALLGRHYRRAIARRQDVLAWRLYTAAVNGGVTTTVYPDRIEQTSARWQQTVFFTQTARLVEDEDWLLVEDGGNTAVVAAHDVTPLAAQQMFEHMARAIPTERQFQHGVFRARREVVPPPPFTEPPVCYERVRYVEAPSRGMAWPPGLLPWLFCVSLTVCSMFTVLFQVTSSFFIDYLLFFTACFGGLLAAAVLLLLWRGGEKEAPPLALSFTADGLRIEWAEKQAFAAAADVHARRTADGVQLFTPAGVFTVPWSATEHRQQLEWMLFHRRPSSF